MAYEWKESASSDIIMFWSTKGIQYRGDLQQLWLQGREDTTERVVKQQSSNRDSDISSWQNCRVWLEYFHILLIELKIYFNPTRGDCGKKSRDCCGEVYFVSMEFKWGVFHGELMRQLTSFYETWIQRSVVVFCKENK